MFPYHYSIFHTMFLQLLINRAMADQMSDIQTKLLPSLAKRTSSTTDEEEETRKKGKKSSHYEGEEEEGEEGFVDDEVDDREGGEEKGMLYDPDLL